MKFTRCARKWRRCSKKENKKNKKKQRDFLEVLAPLLFEIVQCADSSNSLYARAVLGQTWNYRKYDTERSDSGRKERWPKGSPRNDFGPRSSCRN